MATTAVLRRQSSRLDRVSNLRQHPLQRVAPRSFSLTMCNSSTTTTAKFSISPLSNILFTHPLAFRWWPRRRALVPPARALALRPRGPSHSALIPRNAFSNDSTSFRARVRAVYGIRRAPERADLCRGVVEAFVGDSRLPTARGRGVDERAAGGGDEIGWRPPATGRAAAVRPARRRGAARTGTTIRQGQLKCFQKCVERAEITNSNAS